MLEGDQDWGIITMLMLLGHGERGARAGWHEAVATAVAVEMSKELREG